MANTNDSSKIFKGAPKAEGAIFRAPLGTTLPTDAATALDAAYKPMGYVTEDGMTESESRSYDSIKEWGLNVVDEGQTEYGLTYTFTLMETNENALKARFGAENVTVTGDSIHIKRNAKEMEYGIWVVDMAISADTVKRVVIEKARPQEFEDIEYKANQPIQYGMTLNTVQGADGEYVHEYIAKVSE